MSTILKVVGGFFLAAGAVWAITIGVAVAKPGTSLTTQIPGLIFHFASMFVGLASIGVSMRLKKAVPAVQRG